VTARHLPDLRTDLHIHSTASDGSWSPEEVVVRLIEKGIRVFSVTDHDSVENTERVAAEGERRGLAYLPGVEVSVTYQGMEHHITAYGFDPEATALSELLAHNQQVRREHNLVLIEELARRDRRVDLASYVDYDYDPRRGGWKPLNYLHDRGVAEGLEDYWSVTAGLVPEKVFLTPAEGILAIESSGGVPFLAHPSGYGAAGRMPAGELEAWVRFGVRGVECYSSSCSTEDAEAYARFCAECGLLVSGGSDCHGAFLARDLGFPEVTLGMLRLGDLLDRLQTLSGSHE